MEQERSFSGSCLCGEVRFTATGKPERFYHCHCSRCRKATGTAHASNLFVKGSLSWDRGEERLGHFRLRGAKGFGNDFCSECGSRMPRFVEKLGIVFIPAGSLDEEPGIEPQARIFMDSRSDWSCGPEELPEFDEYPG